MITEYFDEVEAVGVSPKTLLLWQKLPEIERAFREGRRTSHF